MNVLTTRRWDLEENAAIKRKKKRTMAKHMAHRENHQLYFSKVIGIIPRSQEFFIALGFTRSAGGLELIQRCSQALDSETKLHLADAEAYGASRQSLPIYRSASLYAILHVR